MGTGKISKKTVQKLCEKSIIPIILWGMFRNYSRRKCFVPGSAVKLVGTSDSGRTVAQSVEYINGVYSTYLQYSGYTKKTCPWNGMRILELGPGENFGVALRFLMDGAAQVVCADKYAIKKDPKKENLIYRAVVDNASDEQRARMAGIMDCSHDPVEINKEKLIYLTGCPAEDLSMVSCYAPFDWIVSWAVMQYVKDMPIALRQLQSLLKDGGGMMHKIDFRDDGMFSQYGHHELTFLTMSKSLYALMTNRLFRPNRVLIPEYEKIMKAMNISVTAYISQLYGMDKEYHPYISHDKICEKEQMNPAGFVKTIRGSLAVPYRSYTDAELAVCGALLVGSLNDGDRQ